MVKEATPTVIVMLETLVTYNTFLCIFFVKIKKFDLVTLEEELKITTDPVATKTFFFFIEQSVRV